MRLQIVILLLVFVYTKVQAVRLLNATNHDVGQLTIFGGRDTIYNYPLEYYIDEFTPIIYEDTLDERLSNKNYFYAQKLLFDKNVHRFNSSNQFVIDEYQRYISGPEVDQKRCTEHLQQMVNLLEELQMINKRKREKNLGNVAKATHEPEYMLDARHIRLAKVLDSYGHYSSGILEDSIDIAGSTLECLETKLQFDAERPSDLIKTRTCVAKLDMEEHLTPDFKIYKFHYPAELIVQICLPNSCHSNSLEANKHLIQKLVDSQFIMPESLYVHQHRKIVELFCLNDNNESIGIPTNGKVLLVLISCWLAAMIYASLRSNQSSLFDRYFNIKHSIEDFIGLNEVNKELSLDYNALNWIRIVCSFGVVFGHNTMVSMSISKDLGRTARIVDNNTLFSLYLQLLLLTNIFFTMSGVIAAHIILKKIHMLKRAPTVPEQIYICVKLIAHRYLRLMPIYFLVYWFRRSIYLYKLSGLMMDRGYNEHTLYGSCKSESWLTPWLGQSSYLPLTAQCMPQAWTIACELLNTLVCAPIIVLMTRRPKLAFSVTILVIIGSLWSLYSEYLTIDPMQLKYIDSFFVYTLLDTMSNFSTIHTKSHNRLSCYFLAIIIGYLLHQYNWEAKRRWPRWFSNHATKWSILIFFIPIITGFLRQQISQYTPMDTKVLLNILIFAQLIWPASVAVLIIRMMTDWKSNYIMQLLLGNFWRTLAKLGYGILLVHTDFVYQSIASAPSLPQSDTPDNSRAIYLDSMLLSLAIHLLFERPFELMANDLLSKFEDYFAKPSRRPISESDTKSNKID